MFKLGIDGIIERGESRLNEALLTGVKAVKKGPGDEVIGGSTNGEGVLYIKVNGTLGDQSFISQVQNLISQAQSQPSRAKILRKRLQGGSSILLLLSR